MTDLPATMERLHDTLDAIVRGCDIALWRAEQSVEHFMEECTSCDGHGVQNDHPCAICKGEGEVKANPHDWALRELELAYESARKRILAHRDHVCRFTIPDDERMPTRCSVCGRDGDI